MWLEMTPIKVHKKEFGWHPGTDRNIWECISMVERTLYVIGYRFDSGHSHQPKGKKTTHRRNTHGNRKEKRKLGPYKEGHG